MIQTTIYGLLLLAALFSSQACKNRNYSALQSEDQLAGLDVEQQNEYHRLNRSCDDSMTQMPSGPGQINDEGYIRFQRGEIPLDRNTYCDLWERFKLVRKDESKGDPYNTTTKYFLKDLSVTFYLEKVKEPSYPMVPNRSTFIQTLNRARYFSGNSNTDLDKDEDFYSKQWFEEGLAKDDPEVLNWLKRFTDERNAKIDFNNIAKKCTGYLPNKIALHFKMLTQYQPNAVRNFLVLAKMGVLDKTMLGGDEFWAQNGQNFTYEASISGLVPEPAPFATLPDFVYRQEQILAEQQGAEDASGSDQQGTPTEPKPVQNSAASDNFAGSVSEYNRLLSAYLPGSLVMQVANPTGTLEDRVIDPLSVGIVAFKDARWETAPSMKQIQPIVIGHPEPRELVNIKYLISAASSLNNPRQFYQLHCVEIVNKAVLAWPLQKK